MGPFAALFPMMMSAAAPTAAGATTAASAALPAAASTTAAATPGIMGSLSPYAQSLWSGLTSLPNTAAPTGGSLPMPAQTSVFGPDGAQHISATIPRLAPESPPAFRFGNMLRTEGGGALDLLKHGMLMRTLFPQQHGGAAPQIPPIPVPPPLPIRFDSGGMGGDPIQQLMMALQNR